MAQEKIINEKASFTTKHRAKCKDDSYSGPWRSTVAEAREDAIEHRSEPGNDLHIIWILTRQELGIVFDD